MTNKITRIYSLAFCRPLFYNIHKKLWAIGLRGMGFMNYHDYRVTGELGILKKIKRNRRNIKVIFDVGANVGTWSKMANEIFPNAKIYAFEPLRETYNLMKNKKNINKYRFGFGESESKLEINFAESGKGQILYSDIINPRRKNLKKVEKIKIRKIDNFCEEERINKIDFLKIDIEGYEFKALKGARKMIDEGRIEIIQFEMGEDNYFNRENIFDFKKMLKNYDFYRLLSNGTIKINLDESENKISKMQNIVAIKK